MANLTGSVAWKVMWHLLKERPTFRTSRELANRLTLHHGQVNAVIGFLRFHRALKPTPDGWGPDWERLTQIMGALRLPSIAPAREFELDVSQDTLADALRARHIPFVFAFTTAANMLAYFEPQPDICLYTEPTALKEFQFVARERKRLEEAGGALVIPHSRRSSPRTPRGRLLVFTERFSRLDTTQTKIAPATSIYQTYIDLLHYPLAGAHAQFLRSVIEAKAQREQELQE